MHQRKEIKNVSLYYYGRISGMYKVKAVGEQKCVSCATAKSKKECEQKYTHTFFEWKEITFITP